MDIFSYINKTYYELDEEIQNTYKNIDKLNEYEKPELMHLLLELRFSNEILFGHDEDYPEYETLQKDFFNVMSNGIKLVNYFKLLNNEVNPLLVNLIYSMKFKYYEYVDDEEFEK